MTARLGIIAFAAGAAVLAWVGAGFATALMGAWVLWRGDPHAMTPGEGREPIARDARGVDLVDCTVDLGRAVDADRGDADDELAPEDADQQRWWRALRRADA